MNDNSTLIDNKYVLGARSSVVDNRRKWEDRVFAGQVERPSGTKLIVGIVADGVGSADYGSRGAQLAVDKAVEYLKNGQAQNIPELIKNAIEYANKAVFDENQVNNGDGLTTLVVSVIHNDRLFIGNVGDSRAYWVQAPNSTNRNGKLLQLTRDHSYYNIYGGDPNEDHANALVNSIGNTKSVQVDLGFYLKGPDVEKAYELGLTGLPLRPGDTVMLCSDGLIKSSPEGNRYATDQEIVESVVTEFEPEKAVIKMISFAEGRKADDNVSAVTIQYLSPELIKTAKARTAAAQQVRKLRNGAFGLAGVVLIVVIAFLIINLSKTARMNEELRNLPTQTAAIITNTPQPTPTPLQIGDSVVNYINGDGANVPLGSDVKNDEVISTTDGILGIAVGELNNETGNIYLFKNSSVKLVFNQMMEPALLSGAIYIQPGSPLAYVDLGTKVQGLKASVSGSRMIVEMQDNLITLYCFEGRCLYEPENSNPFLVPTGSKMVFHVDTLTTDAAESMTYQEEWDWNVKCDQLCLNGLMPTPTSSIQATRSVLTPTPTQNGLWLFHPKKPTAVNTQPVPTSTPKPPTATVKPTTKIAPTKTPTGKPGIKPSQTVAEPTLEKPSITPTKIKATKINTPITPSQAPVKTTGIPSPVPSTEVPTVPPTDVPTVPTVEVPPTPEPKDTPASPEPGTTKPRHRSLQIITTPVPGDYSAIYPSKNQIAYPTLDDLYSDSLAWLNNLYKVLFN